MALFGKRKDARSGAPAAESGPTPVTGLADLHTIAARGTVTEVQPCLDAGADINEPNRVGYTPLTIAASRGDVEITRALLEAGADVTRTDAVGTTALGAAVMSRAPMDVIALLVEHGADANRPNNRGQSPLDLARKSSSTEVVALLAR
jgi:ankyrin repeat protein